MASHVSILVTGERDLADRYLVWSELDRVLEPHSYDSIALYVGDCPTGADEHAREWWRANHGVNAIPALSSDPLVHVWAADQGDGFTSLMSVFVADWYPNGGKTLDKSAGPKRNYRMAKRFVADHGMHALAFWSGRGGHSWKRERSGTLNCMAWLAGSGASHHVISTARRTK